MTRTCIYICVFLISCCFHSLFGQSKTELPIIVIDPGHGGFDKGAIGANGVQEKDVVLKVAKEVLRLNREHYSNSFEIYSTRYTDTLISLRARSDLIKSLKADVFISIHCNQAIPKTARGVEVYINESSSESEAFAKILLEEFENQLALNNRGFKHGNLQVLQEGGNAICVLVELGFLSNRYEAEHIRKRSSISGYALAILECLLKYFKND